MCVCVGKHFKSHIISSRADPGFVRPEVYTTFGGLQEK